jgi:penicillin-binding protein 2
VAVDDRSNITILMARFKTLSTVILIAVLILSSMLFYLQVVRAELYKQLAFSNRIRRQRVIAPRGIIRDRNGEKLVVNIPVYQICILPSKVGGRDELLSIACRWLNVDEERLRENLGEWVDRFPDMREMPVIQAADKEQISILRENRELFPFFKLALRHRREYPEGSLAAHLLGYVGEVTEDDLQSSSNYHRGDIIGRSGVEFAGEPYLKGVDGERLVEISAEGIEIGVIDILEGIEGADGIVGSRAPVPGRDILLTIDVDLQREVERIFTWDKGSVVILDPRNGEVLAAVSRPTYDPNMFIGGVSAKDWKRLYEDPANPLFNRTIQATYPPGSTFKLITAYAALSNGLVGRNQYLKPCFGSYRFGNRNFGCWRPEGHGSLSLHGAISQSCDVYFYQLGELLTTDQFAAAGRIFGLGKKTGVDLPSEAVGIIPDHAYFDRRFGTGRWTKGHLLNYSIGQGEILTTPLQICLMTAIFANGGKRIQPHVVHQIVDFDGRSTTSYSWDAVDLPMIDKRVLQALRGAMEGVVAGERGTGRAGAIPGVKVAGKTGTSQNPHGEDHALFVAYAPADDPVIALAVVMENAGHGGAMAAPVARSILMYYFYGTSEWENVSFATSTGCF